MKKKITLLTVLIILAALLAALYFVILKPQKDAETDAKETSENETSETDAAITVHSYGESPAGIAYTLDDGTEISFSCKDGAWSYDGDAEFPVTQVTLNEIAKNLAKIKATRVIEIADGETAESYGLTDTSRTVKLTSDDGKTDVYKIGSFLFADEYCYVENEGKIYICESTIADNTVKVLNDYLTLGAMELAAKLKKVVLDGKEVDSDLNKVADIYNQIVLVDAVDYKNKEKYGFDGTQHVITVTRTETNDVTDESGAKVSSVGSEADFTFEAVVDEAGNSYIMLEGDPLIYRAPNLDKLFEVLGE